MTYVNQTTMLYSLTVFSAICWLHLNKTGRKISSCAPKKSVFYSISELSSTCFLKQLVCHITLCLSKLAHFYYLIWDQSFYIFIIDEATGEVKIADSLRPVPSPHSMKEVELETSSFPWIITASLPFLSVKTPAVLLKLLRGVVLTSCSLTCILWRLWYLLIALWSATHRTITLVHFSNCHTQPVGFIFLWPVICSEFCLRFFSSDMATQKTFPLKH